MKASINDRISHVKDTKALKSAIYEEWDKFTPADFEKMIWSMSNWIKECISGVLYVSRTMGRGDIWSGGGCEWAADELCSVAIARIRRLIQGAYKHTLAIW